MVWAEEYCAPIATKMIAMIARTSAGRGVGACGDLRPGGELGANFILVE